MKKNEEFDIIIEDMGVNGEGIGKAEGIPLFVKDAVIGDRVRVRVTKMKKTYGYARLMEVLVPSPYRAEPKCPIARQCGGCQLQALDYQKQLEFKQKKVLGNLQRIGGFKNFKILDTANSSQEILWQETNELSGQNFSGSNNDSLEKEPADSPIFVDPIIGMKDPWHYRNKAQFPVGRDKDGDLVAGFYAGHSHRIIPNRDCPIGASVNREILDAVLGLMGQYRIEPYDETRGTGLVRHILIRCGYHTGEIMVCLVINGKELPFAEAFIKKLKKIKGMTSISISCNTKQTNVIMGDTAETLWGKPYIIDTIGGISYQISPLSFFQINPAQTEKLYRTALAYTGLTGEFPLEGTKPQQQLVKTGETETALPPEKIKETEPILSPEKMKKSGENCAAVPIDSGKKKTVVWDLYCGIGTISLFLAQHADQVYGVEIIPRAVEDARRNAAANGITNAEFFVGKAEEILPAFYQQERKTDESGQAAKKNCYAEGDAAAGEKNQAAGKKGGKTEGVDVIVVDPPRKGCDAGLLETILKIQPQRIVYVSCDSATLARDLKILCADGNYQLERVRVCDQFCHTVHVETVVLMSIKNKEPEACINVNLDMADCCRVTK